MKIGICGGGDVLLTLDTSISYIGVDSGIETLLKRGIKPIVGVGDFDSIKNKSILEDIDIKILPARKDITDTHYALLYALKKGYDEIIIYGVTGGRIDHFMAVISLLQQYPDKNIVIKDKQNKIQILPIGRHTITNDTYTYFSLFAIADTDVTITSCEYPLDLYHLTSNNPLCVSNQVKGEAAYVETTKSIILIQSKD